eukprot:TRINITY_DN12706_c0_g1_i2.p2 TRINITY_DN12706_c0_g1~~TRINITY_DN12706_c0_g1_i2.p2  ORF type:complete len:116 (+),score=2.80 TRINITY_DN12706_c0_g1_i2:290-637(+)
METSSYQNREQSQLKHVLQHNTPNAFLITSNCDQHLLVQNWFQAVVKNLDRANNKIGQLKRIGRLANHVFVPSQKQEGISWLMLMQYQRQLQTRFCQTRLRYKYIKEKYELNKTA